MGNWYCKCGKRMSDGLSPTPHGYEVYTSKQCCDGDLDDKRPYADAYICPKCGRLMVFGRGTDRYILYRPELDEDTSEDSVETNDAFTASKSFSNEAWEAYSALCEKEDSNSIRTVNDINALLEQLQKDDIRELSVRNCIVGAEHQICYRIHKNIVEVISLEWIFE